MSKELFDSNVAMYVLGYLMQKPNSLLNEKYFLSTNDFTKAVYKIIFSAVYNLASQGARNISPQDIDLYLGQYNEQYKMFSDAQGLNLVTQLEAMDLGHDEAQFDYHYNKLKKFTILRDLERAGIDTTEFFNPDVDFLTLDDQSKKLDGFTINDILDKVRVRVSAVEKNNVSKNGDKFKSMASGLRELRKQLQANPDIGGPLDGDIINWICKGRRPGKYYLISAPTGGGKTRTMAGACFKASLPRIEGEQVVASGDLQRSLYIGSEQEIDEIQTLMLAYVSGINEEKIKQNLLTDSEQRLLDQAVEIIEQYSDNIYFDMLPSPSVAELRVKMTEPILNQGVENIFYDYIFIPTEDFGVRRDLRTDQLLMLISNCIKEVAVQYNVFAMAATQVNGTWEGKYIRNQNMIRDSKAIADKADMGMILCPCLEDEYEKVKTYCEQLSLPVPTQVVDVYKNRGGSINGVKIFRKFDYGTCRCDDLLLTTQGFKLYDQSKIGKINYSGSAIGLLDFLTRGDKK